MPKVSIIMIFLDARQFIAEAIDSVLAQSFDAWELILVDDGSKDGTSEIAAHYCDAHPDKIRRIAHPGGENRGTGASRNLGVRDARGELIAFLDADDVYHPKRLERHVSVLERHPDLAMVQSCLEYWHSWRDPANADTRELPPPLELNVPIAPPRLLAAMLRSQGATVPGVCSVTIRREVVERLGAFEDDFSGVYEDQVLLAKVYLETKVLVLDDCLARYRQHPASLVHRAEASGDYTPGRPDPSRRRFLQWLEAYLQQRAGGLWIDPSRQAAMLDQASTPLSQQATPPKAPEQSLLTRDLPTIHACLRKELLPFRNPLLWKLLQLPATILRWGRWVAERTLPQAMVSRLVCWRGKRKVAAMRMRAIRS
jgi:glycosyltransferase involved in cell wall biosynthesis